VCSHSETRDRQTAERAHVQFVTLLMCIVFVSNWCEQRAAHSPFANAPLACFAPS
jgi:hypothetical protein